MFAERFKRRLKVQKSQGLHRSPPVIESRDGRYVYMGGRKILNFASNDYLGLASSRKLAGIVGDNFTRRSSSSSSSRLVSGNYSDIRRAERAYADYFGYEEAVFFPSGYQANMAVISTLFENGDTVIFDKHVHASCIMGMRMSGASLKGYKHNAMGHLLKRLERAPEGGAAVITESLFSMDGDILHLREYGCFKNRHRFLSIVDEAHAFGVLGEDGRGVAGDVADIALGTFGKALGLFGAFVLMPAAIREYLVNFASPLIYTTALPEAHALSAMDLLEKVSRSGKERFYLSEISGFMRQSLIREGFAVSGDAHIVAVEIGDEEKAAALSRALLEKGILAFSARYPTVPAGKAILRLGMTALHREKDVRVFVETLKALMGGEPHFCAAFADNIL